MDLTNVIDIGVPVLVFNFVSHDAGILTALVIIAWNLNRVVDRLPRPETK